VHLHADDPELAYTMLACARIGAVHSIVFGGFSRRGSAVHPLHLRLDRQAQGRAAHHRRLSGLRRDDAQYVFDYHDGDVYWCTADVGWVTGHSYIVYGPLANGATTLMFEGVPTYPTPAASGSRRQAQGQHLLHRADRHPRADGRRR
jgi:acyl-coenzyme A synthetase/AMP-(fatty) acid ligase